MQVQEKRVVPKSPSRAYVVSCKSWEKPNTAHSDSAPTRCEMGMEPAQSLALTRWGLSDWLAYDREAVYQSLLEHAARVAIPARHAVEGLTIECDAHLYHPDVDSSSQFLLRHLRSELADPHAAHRMVELGSGTGVVSLVLAKRLPRSTVTGLDIDPQAVMCARGNARRNELEVRFQASDLFAAVAPDVRFDVIVFGIPFFADTVPLSMHPSTRRALCDPEGALLRRFLREAKGRLDVGGRIYLLVSNIGNLGPLNDCDFNQTLVAVERFASGFFRALVKLEHPLATHKPAATAV